MISIKKKISRPFFIMSISIPLAIFVLFNCTVWIYTFYESKDNLEKVARNIEQNFIKKAGKNGVVNLIHSTKVGQGTEIIAFDIDSNIIIPESFDDTFLTPDIARVAYQNTVNTNRAVSFNIGSQSFHAIKISVAKFPRGNVESVVYVARGNISTEFIISINIILGLISLAVITICSLICKKITHQIADPIIKLSSQIEKMDYQTLTKLDDTSSIELYMLTKKINQMNSNIYSYTQEQRSFLQNASHEIRTPLMGILGYSEGIEMGVFENTKETAHLISNEAKRLTRLVSDLLVLSRAESFVNDGKLEKHNISEILSEIVLLYKPMLEEIKLDFICDEKIERVTNKELLIAVVTNILTNAIRYTKTMISLKVIENQGMLVITIRDDGDGIKDIHKIFDRFYKGEKGNFGLGLSIAFASIEALGGSIRAYNDNGAVFEIKL